ncbi:MAG: hypothetical protein LBC12_03365 [Nitrososphaerota archaeon]|nr:hypothetical protein [Nitrososphaerota archaeon]
MIKFENIKDYRDEEFRRITGVKRTTFEKMLEFLSVALTKRFALGGPKPRPSLEDMLLACLSIFENITHIRMLLQAMA